MKKITSKIHISITSILFVIGIWFLSPKEVKAEVQVSVGIGFDVFYNDLDPDGYWVNDPSHGYVWVPQVEADFAPYETRGHWVFTEYGWTWVSDYRWGWATFHYGRWYRDPMYGWIWAPGNEWGPAWVVWSSAPGYYGWAPMEPGWDINIVIGGRDRIPADRWVFVSDRDIGRSDLSHRIKPRSNNVTIIKNTVVINKTYVDKSNNTTYISGPDRNDVEKRTGKRIQALKVRDNDKPGQKTQGNELAIYRPRVAKQASNVETSRPRKVVPLQDVKPIKERQARRTEESKNSTDKSEKQNIDTGRSSSKEMTPNNDQNRDRTKNPDHSTEQVAPSDKNSARVKRGDPEVQRSEPTIKNSENIKNQEALGIIPEEKTVVTPPVQTKTKRKQPAPKQRIQEEKTPDQKGYNLRH